MGNLIDHFLQQFGIIITGVHPFAFQIVFPQYGDDFCQLGQRMVVCVAHVPGHNVRRQIAEYDSQGVVTLVGREVVANHFMIEGVEHRDGADIGVLLKMQREVEHDIVGFRQIPAAKGLLKLENVVLLADTDILFDNVWGNFAVRRKYDLQFLEFGVDA